MPWTMNCVVVEVLDKERAEVWKKIVMNIYALDSHAFYTSWKLKWGVLDVSMTFVRDPVCWWLH